MQADCEYRPAPRFSLKAGYYLNDMSEPGRGNTWVIPVRCGKRLLREQLYDRHCRD